MRTATWQGQTQKRPRHESSWIVPFRQYEIQGVTRLFVDAPHRASEAGYEFLELHAAHGYLAHSFLSPLSNYRSESYGGIFENRIRFTIETFRAMRAAWPENLPLSVRLSCTDWVVGGWTIDD